MALGEFTPSRHYSSFQAKRLCKISKVTVTQNQVVLSVCQGQRKAAALKSVSCSAFNSEEPTAEPEHFWDVQVLQTVPLPSHRLWVPPTLQWETEGPGRSQLCLKEFLLLWEANTWTLLSVFSWIWITQACRAYRESFGPNIEAILTPTFLEYGYFQIKSEFWKVNVSGHS